MAYITTVLFPEKATKRIFKKRQIFPQQCLWLGGEPHFNLGNPVHSIVKHKKYIHILDHKIENATDHSNSYKWFMSKQWNKKIFLIDVLYS